MLKQINNWNPTYLYKINDSKGFAKKIKLPNLGSLMSCLLIVLFFFNVFEKKKKKIFQKKKKKKTCLTIKNKKQNSYVF